MQTEINPAKRNQPKRGPWKTDLRRQTEINPAAPFTADDVGRTGVAVESSKIEGNAESETASRSERRRRKGKGGVGGGK